MKETMSKERYDHYQNRFDSLVRDFVDEHGYAGKDHRIIMANLFIKTTNGESYTDLPFGYRGDK